MAKKMFTISSREIVHVLSGTIFFYSVYDFKRNDFFHCIHLFPIYDAFIKDEFMSLNREKSYGANMRDSCSKCNKRVLFKIKYYYVAEMVREHCQINLKICRNSILAFCCSSTRFEWGLKRNNNFWRSPCWNVIQSKDYSHLLYCVLLTSGCFFLLLLL